MGARGQKYLGSSSVRGPQRIDHSPTRSFPANPRRREGCWAVSCSFSMSRTAALPTHPHHIPLYPPSQTHFPQPPYSQTILLQRVGLGVFQSSHYPSIPRKLPLHALPKPQFQPQSSPSAFRGVDALSAIRPVQNVRHVPGPCPRACLLPPHPFFPQPR